jgi:hypothetical protein
MTEQEFCECCELLAVHGQRVTPTVEDVFKALQLAKQMQADERRRIGSRPKNKLRGKPRGK